MSNNIESILITTEPVSQGDVFIIPNAVIPEGFSKVETKEPNHIIAHSETGHHHVMDASTVDMYSSDNNEFLAYLVVKENTLLLHERSFHNHTAYTFPPGTYRISRQREYIQEGYRRAAD